MTAALDTLPPAARNAAESELIGQRLTVDFAGELRRLIEKPDGLWLMVENFGQVAGAADGLLAHLSALPPEWQQFIGRPTIPLPPSNGWTPCHPSTARKSPTTSSRTSAGDGGPHAPSPKTFCERPPQVSAFGIGWGFACIR